MTSYDEIIDFRALLTLMSGAHVGPDLTSPIMATAA